MAISAKQVKGEETVHHVSARQKRKASGKGVQPPLTPMIDVTFQLLLFFVTACEFRETEGLIPGTLPAKGTIMQIVTDVPPPDPVRIRLRPSVDRESANYEVTGVAVVITSPEELYQSLEARKRQLETAKVPVVILPGAEVPWRFVIEAFNQAVRAKFEKIGFAQERY
jgi:biopolymer transport protein ExbD